MLLKLKNVGRLEPTEIKIDGLTVICGNNNTGKSTVGKTLYCIFNAFHDIDSHIKQEKEELIYRYLRLHLQKQIIKTYSSVAEDIEMLSSDDLEMNKETTKAIENLIRKIAYDESASSKKEIIDRIKQIVQVDRDSVVETFLKRQIGIEFDSCFGNVNHSQKKTEVDLEIKGNHISFSSRGNSGTISMLKYFNLEKTIIYMEDPFVLDNLNEYPYLYYRNPILGHRYQVSQLILDARNGNEQTVAIEEVLRSRKLTNIIGKINQIAEGEMIEEDGKFVYQQDGLKKNLGISSLSSGIKTILIIKELLKHGIIQENGIMVIDEPEVHLHPEWQIKFAEIIVLLQKAYGLNIVLTTHSMDFLSALVTYVKKYEIEKTCNYYLSELGEKDDGRYLPLAHLRHMNDDIQGMYASVSEPFERLYKQMDVEDF